MEEKHPIDHLFRDGLNDPNIPFDERAWESLSKKLHPRKKRMIPLLIWTGSGVAAAIILAVILLWKTDRHPSTVRNDLTQHTENQQPPSRPIASAEREPASPTVSYEAVESYEATEITPNIRTKLRFSNVERAALTAPPLIAAQTDSLLKIAVAQAIPSQATSTRNGQLPVPQEVRSDPPRGWAFSIMAAPDLSGTQPLGGKLSINVGLMATYRFNRWLTGTTGIGYAEKRYETDFANYRPRLRWDNRVGTPQFVDADCAVLDIPLNIGIDLVQRRHSSWFVSAGVSSYLMLRESYEYHYPPHEYGYPKQFTLRNQNQHILGIGNLSVGYRHQFSPTLGVTVQPFVKVPLTGIGNGNLKLYSSGVAISADIDLMQRKRR